MNIYIFGGVRNLTSNYHSGGGLVVVAKNDAEAREMIAKYSEQEPSHHMTGTYGPTDKEWSKVKVYALADPAESNIWVFPDAGCCY